MDNINQAQTKIGEHNDDNDWQIQPRDFVSQLHSVGAVDLANVLADSILTEKAKRYTEADEQALNCQALFKQRAKTISHAIFIGALVTAIISVIAAFSIDNENETISLIQKSFSLGLGLLAILASAVIGYNTHMLSQSKLFEKWMDFRAQAETVRLTYFRQVADILVKHHSENTQLLHEYCCFFRRYQLQVQQAYYKGRSKQHQLSFKATTKLGAISAVIVAGFAGTAGITGFFDETLMNFAAFGAVGVAIGALASRKEALNQDERNGRRYQITAQVLSTIAEKYSNVQRTLAEDKNPAILVHFVEAVHEQLSLEHRQWTKDTAELNSAFMALIKDEEKTN